MELHHCRYFLAVHEAGNITHAAARLGISQPSLSQQILRFEHLLGAKLFDRMGRTIRLTSTGELLVPHARQIIAAAASATAAITGSNKLEYGRLGIAFVPSLERPVSNAVAEFVQKFPKIKIELHQQMSKEINRLILTGEVELGLAAGRTAPPEISETNLYTEPYVLAFRKGHDLEAVKLKKLSAIGDTPFAFFSYGSFARDATDAYLRKTNFVPNSCLESQSLENLLNIIAGSEICALLPKNAVVRRPDMSYHELSNPRPSRAVAILSDRRIATSPAAAEFIAIVRSQAAAHPG